MNRYGKIALAAVMAMGAVGSAGAAFAHHSAAMFDNTIETELTGVVTRFDYLNPHSWLFIEVTNEDGSVTAWGFETNDPSRLRRVGVGPNFWEPGDVITVITNPLRDGRPAGHLVGSIRSDGTTYGDIEGIEPPVAD